MSESNTNKKAPALANIMQLRVCARYHTNQMWDAKYSKDLDDKLDHHTNGLTRVMNLFK